MAFWYQGDIAQAVTKARSDGSVFVVYIEGSDDNSRKFGEIFDAAEVGDKLKSSDFVALKLEANSVPHQQFGQLYPNTAVPSVYFIGKQGKPLEIITSTMSSGEFLQTVDSVLEKHTLGGEASFAAQESQNISSSSAQNPPESTPKPEETKPELSAEEKVKYAQELLDKKREAKQKEEEEEERNKEIERRKMGQNVQNMKKWQQDEELKQLKEDRQKEVRENKAARDRVLAQIAQDKAERAAKFAPPTPSESNVASTSSSPQVLAANSSKSSSNTARLQFRLPDGSAQTNVFESSETLSNVRDYITSNIKLPFSKYTLSTTFPRREFTPNDDSQTLSDLQLVPNAVILVLPVNQGVVSTHSGGGLGEMLWWVLTPFLGVIAFLKSFIFGAAPPQNRGRTNNDANVKRSATSEESERNLPKRRAGETSVIKRQGNVHRLTDRKDDDDDNNTWNGNSTQQM